VTLFPAGDCLLIFNKTVTYNKMNHADRELQEISSFPVEMYDESNEIQIHNKFYYQTFVVISNRL